MRLSGPVSVRFVRWAADPGRCRLCSTPRHVEGEIKQHAIVRLCGPEPPARITYGATRYLPQFALTRIMANALGLSGSDVEALRRLQSRLTVASAFVGSRSASRTETLRKPEGQRGGAAATRFWNDAHVSAAFRLDRAQELPDLGSAVEALVRPARPLFDDTGSDLPADRLLLEGFAAGETSIATLRSRVPDAEVYVWAESEGEDAGSRPDTAAWEAFDLISGSGGRGAGRKVFVDAPGYGSSPLGICRYRPARA